MSLGEYGSRRQLPVVLEVYNHVQFVGIEGALNSVNKKVGAQVGSIGGGDVSHTLFGKTRASLCLFSGTPHIPSGGTSREQGEKATNGLQNAHDPGLKGQPRLRLSRISRAGLLNQVIGLEAMILGIFGASFALTKGFPLVRNGRENFWRAGAGLSFLVGAGLFVAVCW